SVAEVKVPRIVATCPLPGLEIVRPDSVGEFGHCKGVDAPNCSERSDGDDETWANVCCRLEGFPGPPPEHVRSVLGVRRRGRGAIAIGRLCSSPELPSNCFRRWHSNHSYRRCDNPGVSEFSAQSFACSRFLAVGHPGL